MASSISPALNPVDIATLTFTRPAKRIQTHHDIRLFHSSPAYSLITGFIVHLNSAVSPLDATSYKLSPPEEYFTSAPSITVSPEVEGITKLIDSLSDLVESAPPHPGPRRYGNVAFRKWLQLVETHIGGSGEVDVYLPKRVLPAKQELQEYLKHSFGSAERLDYGTGHELAFATFLCGIWVLGGFQSGRDEKALVFRSFNAYFKLVRKLVTTYNLEPAGSHGVWGLDDHVFLPYIFGSAQLTTFRPTNETQAAEANTKAEEANLPKPADVVKVDVVNRERSRNLYFDAIGFIYDVKRGPFWEHSPILFDISGVQKGWGKINEGMLKMYDKEVLSKFPVIQHFLFGSIFRWSDSQAQGAPVPPRRPERSTFPYPPMETTRAPWTSSTTSAPLPIVTRAPWAAPQLPPYPISADLSSKNPPPIGQLDGGDTKAPGITPTPPRPDTAGTKAPWATASISPQAFLSQGASPHRSSVDASSARTRLPWETPKGEAGEAKEASGVNIETQAHLGPRRTSSPDSALARAAGGVSEEWRGSLGTGGVRVAEKGDLSGRRASRTG